MARKLRLTKKIRFALQRRGLNYLTEGAKRQYLRPRHLLTRSRRWDRAPQPEPLRHRPLMGAGRKKSKRSHSRRHKRGGFAGNVTGVKPYSSAFKAHLIRPIPPTNGTIKWANGLPKGPASALTIYPNAIGGGKRRRRC